MHCTYLVSATIFLTLWLQPHLLLRPTITVYINIMQYLLSPSNWRKWEARGDAGWIQVWCFYFYKVVWRHSYSEVVKFVNSSVGSCFQRYKNYRSRPRNTIFVVKKVARFLWPMVYSVQTACRCKRHAIADWGACDPHISPSGHSPITSKDCSNNINISGSRSIGLGSSHTTHKEVLTLKMKRITTVLYNFVISILQTFVLNISCHVQISNF